MNKLEIDDVTPNSVALLVAKEKELLLQQGGIATRMCHDRIEIMDLEAFVTTEVPKLRRSTKSDARELYAIRDSLTSSLSLMLDGIVHKYTLSEIADIPLDTLNNYLRETDTMVSIFPDVKYPLIGYVETKDTKYITVLLEGKSMQYKAEELAPGARDVKVYLPPLWFQVEVSKANALRQVRLVCAPESEVNCENTQLKVWPLTNVFSDTKVCLGTVRATVSPSIEPTNGVVLQHAMNLVFNAERYAHIPWVPRNLDELEEVYANSPHKEEFDTYLNHKSATSSTSIRGLVQILAILKEPTGWMTLPYDPIPYTATCFLNGKGARE